MPKQNTPPAEYPQAVLQQIEQLARHIAIARKRRGETQAQWARKLGVSQPTMARIERGDPSVAMASYVMCMWLIQPDHGLADLISPLKDHAALEHEVAQVTGERRKPIGTERRRRAQSRAAGAAVPEMNVQGNGPDAFVSQSIENSQARPTVNAVIPEAQRLPVGLGLDAIDTSTGVRESDKYQAKSAVEQALQGVHGSSAAQYVNALDSSVTAKVLAGISDQSTISRALEAYQAKSVVEQALQGVHGSSAAQYVNALDSSVTAKVLAGISDQSTISRALEAYQAKSAVEQALQGVDSSSIAQYLDALNGSVVPKAAAELRNASAIHQLLGSAHGVATNPNAVGLAALLAAHKDASS